MDKIDFVVTWVDMSDSKWMKKHSEYASGDSVDKARFREYGLFKYWFRSVEKYAPWVNKIYLITDDQTPEWIDKDNDKLKIVDHKSFIPKEYLPTFNSNTIELFISRIPELSEHFVLFNDDFFINKAVDSSLFFDDKSEKPKYVGALSFLDANSSFYHIILNNLLALNKVGSYNQTVKKHPFRFLNPGKYGIRLTFKTIVALTLLKNYGGFFDSHNPTPYLKSEFDTVTQKYCLNEVKLTAANRERSFEDISHWLVRYWAIITNNFSPLSRSEAGAFYVINEIKQIQDDFTRSKSNFVCVNDSTDYDASADMEIIKRTLEDKFPRKSSFEKE